MAQFIHNLILAAKTANDRDTFNRYDFIGATLVALLLVLAYIVGSALDALN